MTATRTTRIWCATALTAGLVVLGPAAVAADEGDGHGGGQGGPSTPDVTVLAQDPGTSEAGLRITLTAHTSRDAVPSASLVLRVGEYAVSGYEVHRVAVGDTSCGGHDDAMTSAESEGTRAVVRGVGVLRSGTANLPAGSEVQVWVDLRDNGPELYGDDGRVRIRPAPHGEELTAAEEETCPGGSGGWTVDTKWTVIQQVRTKVLPR